MDDNSQDYKAQLREHLKDVEGFSPTTYKDTKGNDTVGYGFNLNSPDTVGYMKLHGLDPERMKTEGMGQVDADTIQDFILNKDQEKLNQKLPNIFNNLQSNQQAALGSLHYNSPKLIGPNLTNYIANGDNLNAAREILANSNKNKELGIGFRRMKEADMFSGGNLGDVFKILSPEEKANIIDMVNSSDNENVKRDIIQKYGDALGLSPQKISFNKLR